MSVALGLSPLQYSSALALRRSPEKNEEEQANQESLQSNQYPSSPRQESSKDDEDTGQ